MAVWFFLTCMLVYFQMLDVKSRAGYPNSCAYPVISHSHSPVFICPPPRPEQQYCSQDLYNPVYEELSNGKCMCVSC